VPDVYKIAAKSSEPLSTASKKLSCSLAKAVS